MKVVKVQSRWRLREAGMSVALRFDSWCKEAQAVEKWLTKNRGTGGWSRWPQVSRGYEWATHFVAPDRNGNRVYLIGLKNPEDATIILLLKDTLEA